MTVLKGQNGDLLMESGNIIIEPEGGLNSELNNSLDNPCDLTSNCHETVISAERPNNIQNQSQVSRKIKNKNSHRKQNKIDSNTRPTKNKDFANSKLNQDEKQSSIGVVVWNLHVLKGNKIDTFKEKNDTVVKKIFYENDIICVTETWRDKYDLDILVWDDNFTEHSKLANRQSKSGRSSGGTTLFIKNETNAQGKIEYQDSYHAWYKLDNKLFPALNKPLYFCFLYIPPNTSRHFKSGISYNFEKLMSDVAKYENMGGEVFIMGDTNARIAEENDFLENNDENVVDDFLPIPDDLELDNNITKRKTLDDREVSGHGKELINSCRMTGLRIINGRLFDDGKIGNFTCMSYTSLE